MIACCLAVSVQNIRDGGGVALSLTGMAIVLLGLGLIAGFIALLPRALQAWEQRGTKPPASPADSPLTPEVRAALAWVAAQELETLQLGDRQRLTFRPAPQPSPWQIKRL